MPVSSSPLPDYDRIDREMAAHGLRPSRVHHLCVRVVAGKRCGLDRHPYQCPCGSYRWILDHGHMWLDAQRRHVLSGDPYDLQPDAWAHLVAHCAEMGVREPTQHAGVWYPGYTTLILVRPR